MASLAQDSKGNYRARKRLPDDVREDYGRLYGQRYEAKFSAPKTLTKQDAMRQYGEWLAEVEGRIAAIRTQRKGEGLSLTPRQARALAGEWYDWFVERHPVSDQKKWEDLRDQVHEALQEAAGDDVWNNNNPDDLWREDEDLRKAVRPVLADLGETAQFLGMKGLALSNGTRDRFLDFLYDDLSAALKRLMRISEGDYSVDKYRERFPRFEGADTGETPWQLFEKWVAEREPSASSVESWRYVFREMKDYFKDRSAASITADEAQQWINSLKNPKRFPRTVKKTWLNASRTVFGWAVEHKLIPRNPFTTAKVTVPKHIDGHHRLHAYRKARWKGPIPVEVFEGTLDEARLAALAGNVKDKLKLSGPEKKEAAWRLVTEDKLSKAQIVKLGVASDGTISTMRKVRKKLMDSGEDPTSVSWAVARRVSLSATVDDPADWKEKKAQKIVDALLKAKIGQGLVKDPEVTALALQMLNPSLPGALVKQWWFDDPDLKSEIVEELRMEEDTFDLLEGPEEPEATEGLGTIEWAWGAITGGAIA